MGVHLPQRQQAQSCRTLVSLPPLASNKGAAWSAASFTAFQPALSSKSGIEGATVSTSNTSTPFFTPTFPRKAVPIHVPAADASITNPAAPAIIIVKSLNPATNGQHIYCVCT